MTQQASPLPRVVIVVSRDFGELTNALSFARSAGLDVTLLLPENLYAAQQGLHGFVVAKYRSLAEVEAAVAAARPDAVLLFSGYLFVVSRLFEFAPFERWLTALKSQGTLVMTSDPFLGLLHSSAQQSFETQHPAGDWMVRHFDRTADTLRRLAHVYTAPCSTLDGPRKSAYGLPGSMLRDAQALGRAHRLAAARAGMTDDAFWLYVLSGEDWQIQSQRLGSERFVQLLSARMADAAAAQRLPVLVAPAACVDALSSVAGSVVGWAMPFCEHQRFEDLMLGAEHLFYWNQASNSILLRLVNALPVWFFDEGHLLRMVPGLRELADSVFFGGFGVQRLEVEHVLAPAELARRGEEARPARTALATRYLALNTPSDVVRQALARRIVGDAEPAHAALE